MQKHEHAHTHTHTHARASDKDDIKWIALTSWPLQCLTHLRQFLGSNMHTMLGIHQLGQCYTEAQTEIIQHTSSMLNRL